MKVLWKSLEIKSIHNLFLKCYNTLLDAKNGGIKCHIEEKM